MNGDEVVEAATGVGPVDAAMQAIRKIISIAEPIQLKEYTVEAITGGTDAVVDVSVTLSREGRIVTSRGVHEDIVMASVEAMLNGVNMLTSNRKIKNPSKE
jgi:D-citramalate synthase